MEPQRVVTEFWRRLQARDWDGVGELLADDLVIEWPDTRLRIRGREKFLAFNREYPEGWTIEVLGIVAQGSTVVSEVRVPHSERGVFYVTAIVDVRDGVIEAGREYWLKEEPEALSEERARYFESI